MRGLLPLCIACARAAEFFVHLRDEAHRAGVAATVARRHASPLEPAFEARVSRHLTHLPSVCGFVVSAASHGAAEALGADARVLRVAPLPERSARSTRGDLGGFWYERSHPEGVPWNIDRVNGALDGDGERRVNGSGVSIFVLDSGLDTTHPEFVNSTGWREVENVADLQADRPWRHKPSWGWTDAPADKADNDVFGHGSHCAATAAGVYVGAAPGANVYGVRTVNEAGLGTVAAELDALDTVAGLVSEGRLAGPAVISLSIGGQCPYDSPAACAYEDPESLAIADLRALGVAVVVAAGNQRIDACRELPAASRAAITVGSVGQADVISPFSNFGDCVDIMAPGTDVPSADTGDGDAAPDPGRHLDDESELYAAWSGTSHATPLVAGVLALYLEVFDGAAEDAINALMNRAEVVETRSPSPCATNRLLVRTPNTTDAADLDARPFVDPCPLAPAPTADPTSHPTLAPSVLATDRSTRTAPAALLAVVASLGMGW
mmetsp:Transcript_2951/g.8640  ORF Transcript_2951/g.8640 Transcript_2951/m.8640 type:complete len:494 (+) Transcript_2951:291-1772(+)